MVDKPATTSEKSARSLRGFYIAICGLLLALLLSCSQYEFTLNERTVYDPQEFRRDLQMVDANLLSCTKKILSEQQITKASQLKQLICGPSDINTLDGIEVFTKLEQLGLANNKINNITALAKLTQLQQLNLANNHVENAEVLAELGELTLVDLSGNAQLQCRSVVALKQRNGIDLKLPDHCKGKS